MQDNHVIYYESRKLKENKKNHATRDLKLAAIMNCLKMWRHYLLGRVFKLRNDHMFLKYLFDKSRLNDKKARWLEFLCKFLF